MLPTGRRLTKSAEIKLVKKNGKLIHGQAFSLLFLKQQTPNPSRFAFIVSTKVSKNATIRNRAKRAMREGVRQVITIAKPGFDCLFLAKPIIAKTYTDQIMKEVRELLAKASILD